jgi:FMN phosphatase YigB (HAD superfamily)
VSTRRVAAVAFDIGETLLDRTREYAAWAALLGVSAHTFSAVFGTMIQRGAGVADVVEFFSRETGVMIDDETRRRVGGLIAIAESDLYPDARWCLQELQQLGCRTIVAGNQPAEIGWQLRALNLPADVVAVSSEWGVAKPRPEFFARIAAVAGCEPGEVIYVGDQLDNDVAPALAAGLRVIRLIRGPWGYLLRDPDLERRCATVASSLDEVVRYVAAELA